jgi:hypothetical protein
MASKIIRSMRQLMFKPLSYNSIVKMYLATIPLTIIVYWCVMTDYVAYNEQVHLGNDLINYFLYVIY